MSRVVSPMELKENIDSILRELAEDRESVVIERNGERTAILVPADEYDTLRRNWAWSVVDQLGSLNADREPDDILREVVEVVEEVKTDLYAKRTPTSGRP
ncbi:MAG: type II toxin-antitoxin system Phd/YefM family antitoxin [Thermomicrobiales bacterium]|nr:type II toxin-antitoxin system Phd/YefM family antitoxin [Thermomicrobiales bacterium]